MDGSKINDERIRERLKSAYVVTEDGHFISNKVANIVRAIEDYSNGELEVTWTPPDARREGQAAFAIVHNPPGGMSYVLRYVKDEEAFNEGILSWIIFNDQRNGKQALTELEAWEETQRRLKKQQFLDQMEEANDIAKFAFKTHLNKFTIPDLKNPGRLITIRE